MTLPKTFPRCNNCHVLYPVNLRFLHCQNHSFFHACTRSLETRTPSVLAGCSVIVIMFISSIFLFCILRLSWACLPYKISSFTWKRHNITQYPLTYTCCILKLRRKKMQNKTKAKRKARIAPTKLSNKIWFKLFLSACSVFIFIVHSTDRFNCWFTTSEWKNKPSYCVYFVENRLKTIV